MTQPSDRSFPVERDIVYFVHLHLNTVEQTAKHEFKEKHWIYRVEGKVRPMLILRVPAGERNGRRWYRVLPITTKGIGEKGSLKPGHVRIGRLPGSEDESFVRVFDVQELPHNMLSADGKKPPVCHSLDRLAFDNVVSIARHCLMSQASATK